MLIDINGFRVTLLFNNISVDCKPYIVKICYNRIPDVCHELASTMFLPLKWMTHRFEVIPLGLIFQCCLVVTSHVLGQRCVTLAPAAARTVALTDNSTLQNTSYG